MTDWDRVRRLRAKGVDWKSIAADPKVHFNPPEGADAARALKTLYLNRKSRDKNLQKGSTALEPEPVSVGRRRLEGLLPVLGFLLLIGGVLWLVISIAFPATAVVLPALPPSVPDILLVVVAGAIVLGVVVVIPLGSLATSWRKGLAAGIAVGIVLAGVSAGIAALEGVPNLNPNTTSEPFQGWEKAANSPWLNGGKPVVFFFGSEACPFCSASSWPITIALGAFGGLSGTHFSYSSSGDTPPSIPEIGLSSSSLQSSLISWDVHEDPNTQTIIDPPVPPVENAYVRTYDSTFSIPFFVVGGMYIHTTSFVSPNLLQGLSAPQVQSDIGQANPNDPVYSAIHTAAVQLEAFFAKACLLVGLTPPSAVTSDPAVQAVLGQIF